MDGHATRETRVEEFGAAMRRARAQADECRRSALDHDRRMESAMQMLDRGWKGPDADTLLRDLEDVRQSLRNLRLAEAEKLDAQSEELQRELRRAEEESEADDEESEATEEER